MPKNKGKGGKKFRRGKHDNESKRQLVLCDHLDNQCYGLVTKILGNRNFSVNCYKLDNDIVDKIRVLLTSSNPNDKHKVQFIDKRFTMKPRICHVRGSMRKRAYVNVNDLVLVSLRDFQDDKADIIYKYENYELQDLKSKKELPDLNELAGESIQFGDMMPTDSEEDDDDDELEHTEKVNYKNNYNKKYSDNTNDFEEDDGGGYEYGMFNNSNDDYNNDLNIDNI